MTYEAETMTVNLKELEKAKIKTSNIWHLIFNKIFHQSLDCNLFSSPRISA